MRGHALILIAAIGAAVAPVRQERPAYLNPDLAPDVRAADLVHRMTLDQKVRQMQNNAPAIPDLGVPAYNWWNEALHGVARAGQATVFPQAIGLAATWDTDLMLRVADTISTEARAKYHEALRQNNHAQYYGLTFWSPNINIFRDPRWGRGQETYGEDPTLTGRLAVAFIKGLQGNDPKYYKVIATAKHFVVHSGPESTRHSADVIPSARDLAETYLPAFRMAMTEGHAASIMCAYNRVDGVPARSNEALLGRTLRGDWQFAGYVVSDCGAIADIYRGHKVVATAGEASAAAVKAGTDLTCGSEYTSLVGAAGSGLITEAQIDQSLVRLFTARMRLGMFDPPERVPYASIPYSEVDSAAHRALALEAAEKSIVLLKNDRHILPLASTMQSIAVVGPSADDAVALLGNYNGFSSKVVTPLEGLTALLGKSTRIGYALGAPYVPGSMTVIPATAFAAPDGSLNLRAEYFDNPDLQGAPKLSRTDARPLLPNVREPEVSAAGVPLQGYSVRWTGTLHAPVTGAFGFTTSAGTNGRIFLDNQELLPVPAAAPPASGAPAGARAAATPATRVLERDVRYTLRVEYRSPTGRGAGGGGGGLQVSWLPPSDALLDEAVALAKQSAVTVAFVGLNPRLEGEEMPVNVPGFAGGDRTDLKLPEPQDRLLSALFATGKPVVVVLTSGSAVALNESSTRAAAIVAAWYGGEEIGTAVANTLAGRSNPSGRLPVTFYKNVSDLPPFESYAMAGRTYRYFTGAPLFPFGFGESYSTFASSDFRARRSAGDAVVSARVKNTSKLAGNEIVQVYLGGAAGAGDPLRALQAFTRVHLEAGEIRDVSFTLPTAGLAGRGLTLHVSIGGGQPIGRTPRVEGVIK